MKFNCKIINKIPDRTPNIHCWMLFKVGTLSRIIELQRGFLYLNSVDYFSNLEGEKTTALRRDELEKSYAIFKTGKTGNVVHELSLKTAQGEQILGESISITVDFPNPKNVMIYCLGALADRNDKRLIGEVDGSDEIFLDQRFNNFGDHMLIITNVSEFSKRLGEAIVSNEHLYGSELFEGGYGQIDYVEMDKFIGPIGLFRKDMVYEWQREYRICVGAKNQSLNENGGLELNIGDISDISKIVNTKDFVNLPFQFKRRTFVKNSDGLS